MLVRHRRRPLRAQPLIHLVPNIFTVMSLCAGLTAIRYGLDQRFELALVLIVVAGVLDGLDGRSARLLKITSKLGAQLDSLAERRYLSPYLFATIAEALGDRRRAFAWLEEAVQDRAADVIWLDLDPRLDRIRGDRRFARIRRSAGLPV